MQHPISLITFDLNGTLITNNTWQELNLSMGMTKEEDEELLRLHEEGKITYREGQKRIEGYYKERAVATKEKVESVMFRYTYVDGAKEVISYLKEKDYPVALITGSIDILAKRVASELHIPYVYAANEFVFSTDGTFVGIHCPEDDGYYKLSALIDLCTTNQWKLTDCVVVGDSENDRKLFEATGHGITWKDSPLAPVAWKHISSLDQIRRLL